MLEYKGKEPEMCENGCSFHRTSLYFSLFDNSDINFVLFLMHKGEDWEESEIFNIAEGSFSMGLPLRPFDRTCEPSDCLES